jgi:heme A synthase
MRLTRFATYAWGVLVYNFAVILWGAFVRATGSGAGCGDHWPLCNGQVVPRAAVVETMVEFTHRMTSGFALLSAIGLIVWAFRAYPKGHRVRRGATASMIFMVTEALLGAGLVLFELVAHNVSVARVFAMGAHLVNTFLLIGTIALTAWWASGFPGIRISRQGPLGSALFVGLFLTLMVGVTGAVIALGDTLFFAHIDRGGTEENLAPLVQTLKDLRIMHPLVAVLSSIYLAVVAWQAQRLRPGPAARPLAWFTIGLIVTQLIIGVLNVYLRVPVYMQLIHLLFADLIWVAMVLVTASAFAVEHEQEEVSSTQPIPRRVTSTI